MMFQPRFILLSDLKRKEYWNTVSNHSNLGYFSEVTSISYTVEICLLRGFFRSVMIPILALHFSFLLDWYKRLSWICECGHDAVIQSAQFASQFVIWKQKDGPCGYLMKKTCSAFFFEIYLKNFFWNFLLINKTRRRTDFPSDTQGFWSFWSFLILFRYFTWLAVLLLTFTDALAKWDELFVRDFLRLVLYSDGFYYESTICFTISLPYG